MIFFLLVKSHKLHVFEWANGDVNVEYASEDTYDESQHLVHRNKQNMNIFISI